MPFKSEAQRRYLWAEHPEMAQRWADEEKAAKKRGTKNMHSKREEGRKAASEVYKVAFLPSMGSAGKWLGRGAKMLGAVPTGAGNLASGVMGAIGGGMEAASQGHGIGGIMAHGLAGATAGIPGGLGMAASALASPVMNKLVPPPGAPAAGQMMGD